VECGG
jgi:hypothetical protein